MQKMRRHILAVAGRVFFIGFNVQIVLGLLWMICNFPQAQQPRVLVQLVVAFLAAYRLLCVTTKTGKCFRIWGSFALLTFPMAMQTHMGTLPDSLAGSCLFLELALAAEILHGIPQVRYRTYAKLLIFWFLSAILQPEYLYFGAIPAAVVCIYAMVSIRKAKAQNAVQKKNVYYVLLLAASIGLIVGCRSLLNAGRAEEVSYQSASLSMVSRFSWPRMQRDYEFWPEEVKLYFSEAQARQTDAYADNVELILGKTLADAVGRERADALFREIARVAWQRRKVNILHDTAWDALGYTFSPIVVQRQLNGKVYDSYTGRNYDELRMQTPLLAKYYLNYSCWWFTFGLTLAIILSFAEFLGYIGRYLDGVKAETDRVKRKKQVLTVLVYVLTSGVMVAWYTLRGAGMMDYKKTYVVGFLWLLWMLVIGIRSLEIPVKIEDWKQEKIRN